MATKSCKVTIFHFDDDPTEVDWLASNLQEHFLRLFGDSAVTDLDEAFDEPIDRFSFSVTPINLKAKPLTISYVLCHNEPSWREEFKGAATNDVAIVDLMQYDGRKRPSFLPTGKRPYKEAYSRLGQERVLCITSFEEEAKRELQEVTLIPRIYAKPFDSVKVAGDLATLILSTNPFE